jgi:[ribosomal protein S5]-alanine N-acetyltransferase
MAAFPGGPTGKPNVLEVRAAPISLRLPEAADAPALFRLASDPEVTRWFSWGPYHDEVEAAAYVERARRRAVEGTQLDLVVVHDEHGVVGVTGLSEVNWRDRRAVVGTWLGREHWGTGINGASKLLVAALAFRHLGLERLGAYADVANVRSQRALEKARFRREGVLRAFHRHGDVQKDVCLYSLLRSEQGWYAYAPAQVTGAPPLAFRSAWTPS